MTTPRKLSERFWRSYGNDPRPTPAEALAEPFRAFPSWYLRNECGRCAKTLFLNESHFARGELLLRLILERMRRESCGGRPARVELFSGAEAASSRPVLRIVLLSG